MSSRCNFLLIQYCASRAIVFSHYSHINELEIDYFIQLSKLINFLPSVEKPFLLKNIANKNHPYVPKIQAEFPRWITTEIFCVLLTMSETIPRNNLYITWNGIDLLR